MKKIAVIGSGITGVTTAYQLSKKGYDVTVFDKERYPGMETSYANGGQLSASNSEVWNSWKTVSQGIKWLMKNDAPLLINPKPSIHKFTWLMSFISNIPNHKNNTIATAKMAIESRKEFNRIVSDEKLEIDLIKRGILHLCRTRENFDHGMKINKWLNDAGLDRQPISIDEIKKN